MRDTPRVLIADDDEGMCDCLDRALRVRGVVPLVAADGLAALELFRERCEEIRVVFLDVRMPRLSGRHALARIRALRPGVSCCLMTAHSDVTVVCADEPSVQVLRKPFDLDEFFVQLEKLLHPHRVLADGPVDFGVVTPGSLVARA